MNVLTHLVRLARALDAYPKDKNPEHWKTINGAHVHVDKNGNYDGGAGGRLNGKHHYGQGYKEKQAAKPRRSAEEIVLSARLPDVKGMSEEALRAMMKKENHYGNWNRARGEILTRLKDKESELRCAFNLEEDKAKKKELREKLAQQKEAVKRFKEESRIPYRFSKASFENDPERAETAYKNNNMLNEEVRADYEKWKANKARTASIMQNLANSLKAEPDVKNLSDDELHERFKEESLQEIKKLEAQIKELNKKAKACWAKAKKLGWRDSEKEQAEYNELVQMARNFCKESEPLAKKCTGIKRKLRKLDEQDNPEEKPFVNGYGEATNRYITSASYERGQRRREKEFASFFGGNRR